MDVLSDSGIYSLVLQGNMPFSQNASQVAVSTYSVFYFTECLSNSKCTYFLKTFGWALYTATLTGTALH